MKHITASIRVATAILCLALSSAAVSAVPAAFQTDKPAIYGKQLMLHSDQVLQGWKDEIVAGKMTLIDANNRSATRAFTRIGLERFGLGDKSIIKFTAPAEIKGVAALNYENSGSSDDNWLYLPATKKVRRISGANNTASFQGSEFTYEDLNDLDPQEYEWRFVSETILTIDGETVPVLKIEGIPNYSDTAYSRLTVYLSKAHWYQVQIDYYDKSGTHLKTRRASQWQQLHRRFWRAQQVEMINHQTGKQTVLSFSQYRVDLSRYTSQKTGKPRSNLSENLFTRRALSQ